MMWKISQASLNKGSNELHKVSWQNGWFDSLVKYSLLNKFLINSKFYALNFIVWNLITRFNQVFKTDHEHNDWLIDLNTINQPYGILFRVSYLNFITYFIRQHIYMFIAVESLFISYPQPWRKVCFVKYQFYKRLFRLTAKILNVS